MCTYIIIIVIIYLLCKPLHKWWVYNIIFLRVFVCLPKGNVTKKKTRNENTRKKKYMYTKAKSLWG